MKLGKWEQCPGANDQEGCWHRYWVGMEHFVSDSTSMTVVDDRGKVWVEFFGTLKNLNSQIQNEHFSTVEEAKNKVDEIVERFLKLSSFI